MGRRLTSYCNCDVSSTFSDFLADLSAKAADNCRRKQSTEHFGCNFQNECWGTAPKLRYQQRSTNDCRNAFYYSWWCQQSDLALPFYEYGTDNRINDWFHYASTTNGQRSNCWRPNKHWHQAEGFTQQRASCKENQSRMCALSLWRSFAHPLHPVQGQAS